ncbi:MAG: helix-turn-helix domain-containing protein [Pseudonocardiaceae bacterium]
MEITEHTREGLAAARARGRRGGRKPKLTAHQVQLAQQLYDTGEKTVGEIAAIFKVPRTTIYGHLDKPSVGSRPRARKQNASTTMQTNSEATASSIGLEDHPDDSGLDFPRPVRVRLRDPEEPISPQEHELRTAWYVSGPRCGLPAVLRAATNRSRRANGGSNAKTWPPSGCTSTATPSASIGTAPPANPTEKFASSNAPSAATDP